MRLISFTVLLICAISTVYSASLVSLTTQCQTDFRKRMVQIHNKFRALHQAPDIVEDILVTKKAMTFAQYLASKDLFQHSNSRGYGENLAYTWSSKLPNLKDCGAIAEKFVQMWYDEVKYYDFNNPGFSMETGHFTQVVWKDSTNLGCGIAVTTSNKVYGVCNYTPAGNMMGDFENNVSPIEGQKK